MSQQQMNLDFDLSRERSVQPVPEAASTPRLQDEKKMAEKSSEILPPEVVEEVQPEILSVSDLNKAIRKNLEGEFGLIWIRGEISNFKPHTSGHFYFSLKDSKSQILAVMFRGFNSHLRFKPHDGMEVLVRGRISVYEPRGNYQILCEVMEPVGQGALQIAFEQLKKKLASEGLFDASRKRPLPAFPKRVAIVTSPTGAAIRDMLNVLGRRNRSVEIVLFPCVVQGVQAAGDIVKAIQQANLVSGFDVMIVGRGGGSIEDMWCFNEEIVARAIAASKIPTVSAVGHEIDFTIADFVADLRAPTPSAAAELIVKNLSDVVERLNDFKRQLYHRLQSQFKFFAQIVHNLDKRLVDPRKKLQDSQQRVDDLVSRLERALKSQFRTKQHRAQLLRQRLPSPLILLEKRRRFSVDLSRRLSLAVPKKIEASQFKLQRLISLLDSLSPLKVLERGFSATFQNARLVKSVSDIKKEQPLLIRLKDGDVTAEVKTIEPKSNTATKSDL